MPVVLDAWAVMAFLQDEPAGALVGRAIAADDARICSINLGEAHYTMVRRVGRDVAIERIDQVRQVVRVESPDWETVRLAADIKAGGGLSYPDAFCVATARRHQAPLYTGDPEIVELNDAGVEIVDLRQAA